MKRCVLVTKLSEIIVQHANKGVYKVGIDGVDAAGKTTLANELIAPLQQRGFPVIRASIDGFHHPRSVRICQGALSPEGYYYDSFNYELLTQYLLHPLSDWDNRHYRVKAFDFQTDTPVCGEESIAEEGSILLFEGVFLQRKELRPYWDMTIFVDVDFEVVLERVSQRDQYLFGDQATIRERYVKRYIPGQQLYLLSEHPKEHADILIDNNDYTNPVLKKHLLL